MEYWNDGFIGFKIGRFRCFSPFPLFHYSTTPSLHFVFEEVEDNPVDFFRGFPHGNVAALFDDVQFRTLDGLMKAFSYGRRKDEVSLTPDEESGMIDEGKVVSHL